MRGDQQVATQQVSLTLDADVLESARQLAGSDQSVSSFVSDALGREVERLRWLRTIEGILSEDPPSPDELQRARKLFMETFDTSQEEATRAIASANANGES